MNRVLAVLGLGFVLVAQSAQATTEEMIVRFRDPQNSQAQAAMNFYRTGMTLDAQSKIEVLNAEEGVVKLGFENHEAAVSAREFLLKASDQILSFAPNLLYKPAIRYRIQEVSAENAGVFLGLPFAELSFNPNANRPRAAGIPEVQLPPAHPATGADKLQSKDWAAKAVHLNQILNVVVNKQISVAVTDTGVDYNHEDLIGGMWRAPGNPKEVGWDFAHNHAKPYDNVHFDVEGCLKDFACRMGSNTERFLVNPGHGTHCAGHVGAVANNAKGIRGAGAGAAIMALKFFYDYGEENAGQGDDAAAIKSIDYAIKHGVRIVSASWGGRTPRAEAEKSELKQALIRAQKAGVLFVVAAGNDGVDQDKVEDPSYPAAYDLDNVITVAATDPQDKLAEFSSFGGRSVHLAAPGVKILSTVVGSKYSDVIAKFKDSNGKEVEIAWDGTSMATPIVAGAAALVWSKYPNEDYKQIRDRLLKSVRKVPALAGKTTSGGVLDIVAALR